MTDNQKLIFEILNYCIDHPKEDVGVKLPNEDDRFYRISCGNKSWVWTEAEHSIWWNFMHEFDHVLNFKKINTGRTTKNVLELLKSPNETKKLFKLKEYW